MTQRNYKTILSFSDQWFTLGVATEESLLLSAAEYRASDDKSTEHYCYGTFRRYLSQHRPLATSDAEALYELGNADPDYSMGGAMMADIVDLPECSLSVIAKALISDRRHLVKKAERKQSSGSSSKNNATRKALGVIL